MNTLQNQSTRDSYNWKRRWMLERSRRYGGRYRGGGKGNGGKQGRRVEKRREGDFLERTSICARFCHPSRTDSSRPSWSWAGRSSRVHQDLRTYHKELLVAPYARWYQKVCTWMWTMRDHQNRPTKKTKPATPKWGSPTPMGYHQPGSCRALTNFERIWRSIGGGGQILKNGMLYSNNNEYNFTKGVAKNLWERVFKDTGLPRKVISDRGSQFISNFMKELCNQLGIKRNPSTAYHPQTDSQTERVNQEMEQYLRLYISYRQDDWAEWLPMVEFAHNNRQHSSTGKSPFFVNLGRHPDIHGEGEKSIGRVP